MIALSRYRGGVERVDQDKGEETDGEREGGQGQGQGESDEHRRFWLAPSLTDHVKLDLGPRKG